MKNLTLGGPRMCSFVPRSCSSSERTEDDTDARRLARVRWNWFLCAVAVVYLFTGFSVTLSTLYHFVTNPANTTCAFAGLGSSEIVYSMAVGMYSGAELTSALATGLVGKRVRTGVLFLCGAASQMLGFIMYGLSQFGFMVILARGLIGFNGGITLSTVYSYIGKSAHGHSKLCKNVARRDLERQLVMFLNVVGMLTMILTIGLSLLITHFPSVDQFRWLAWFEIGLGSLTVLLLLFFRDDILCQCIPTKKSETGGNSISKFACFMMVYLVGTSYNIDACLSVVESIASPIFTDYFGISIDTLPYIFLGAFSTMPFLSVPLLILERLNIRLDMRWLLIFSLSLTTVGLFLLGDWQTIIVPDYCNEFSLPDSLSLGSHDDSGCIDTSCVPLVLSSGNSTDPFNDWIGLVEKPDRVTRFTIYYYNDTPIVDASLNVVNVPCPSCVQFLSSGSNRKCMEYTLQNGSFCTDGFQNGTESGHFFQVPEYQVDICLASVPDLQLSSNPLPPSLFLIELVLNAADSLPPTDTLKAYQECESHSLSPDHCYWVQESTVTGEHCPDCPPLCRSTRKIVPFIQACVAICLLAFTYAGSSIALYVLVIQNTPVRLLDFVVGLIVLCKGLARLVTPIWVTAVYVATGRHTIVPVTVLIALQFPVHVGFWLLCRRMEHGEITHSQTTQEA